MHKREAVAALNYNQEMDMIVFDHLISETGEEYKKYTLVPDLDYEGFKWISPANGLHASKKYSTTHSQQGKAPVGEPVNKSKVDLTRPRTAEDINAETPGEGGAEREEKRKKIKLRYLKYSMVFFIALLAILPSCDY